MKITTRIIAGYGTLIALLAALVAYELFTIDRMQSVNRELSQRNLKTAVSSLELMRERDLVEEYSRKALALGDPGYVDQLKSCRQTFEELLKQVKLTASSPEELAEISRLADFWRTFSTELEGYGPGTRKINDFPQGLLEDLDRLRVQITTVYQANVASVKKANDETARTGETARLISIWTAALAIVLSALVCVLIYRSISIPLAHLTEGTRAIAEGKFYYRLDTSRNDEFSQVAKDFNTMTHRLNELDELKKAFISHVSHELKAPLASMRETIQLILEGIPGPLTEKQRRLLQLNLQSGARLTSMISNLLDLSKIEAGVMEYEFRQRDLAPLVRGAVAEFETQTHEKHLTVEPLLPEQSFRVECDADRIIQVLVNLLGNAVKFSPSGGAIRVCLQRAEQVPSGVPADRRKSMLQGLDGHAFALVSVSDSGPGVPDAEKERIFEKFHQVKQSVKASGQGVGLGLAICRTIVEAHGGAIWVEDNVPSGSVFHFLLRVGGEEESGVVRRAAKPM